MNNVMYRLFGTNESRNGTGHDAENPFPTVATPIVMTPSKDAIFETNKLQDIIGCPDHHGGSPQ